MQQTKLGVRALLIQTAIIMNPQRCLLTQLALSFSRASRKMCFWYYGGVTTPSSCMGRVLPTELTVACASVQHFSSNPLLIWGIEGNARTGK